MIQVADTKNLGRGLVIALELAELGLPATLCLNMADEARAAWDHRRRRGAGRSPGPAGGQYGRHPAEGVDRLLQAAQGAQAGRHTVIYDGEVEAAVREVEGCLPPTHLSPRGLALHYLGGANDLPAALNLPPARQAALEDVRRRAEELAAANGDEPLALRINRSRVSAAQALQAEVLSRRPVKPTLSESIGRMAVHPVWGWPILAAVLYLVYLFVGVLGAGTLVDLLENGLFGSIVNPWITAVVTARRPVCLAAGLSGRRVWADHGRAHLQLCHRAADRRHLLSRLQPLGGLRLSPAAGRHA